MIFQIVCQFIYQSMVKNMYRITYTLTNQGLAKTHRKNQHTEPSFTQQSITNNTDPCAHT